MYIYIYVYMYTYINIYSHICRRPVNRWDLTEAAHGFISTVLYALETGEGLPSLIAGGNIYI
jgi:hypothetical protein